MDKEPLTRREYQARQRHEQEQPASAAPTSDAPTAGERPTREESLRLTKAKLKAERTANLKHRLNLVILGLVVAIVLVYLVLFFVG